MAFKRSGVRIPLSPPDKDDNRPAEEAGFFVITAPNRTRSLYGLAERNMNHVHGILRSLLAATLLSTILELSVYDYAGTNINGITSISSKLLTA